MSWKLDAGRRAPAGGRLQAIEALVPQGARVADVGTDHAHLPLALLASGRAASAIGIDLSPEALEGARANRSRSGVHVPLRVGDGLSALGRDEANVLVIAGMGGRTMARILDVPLWFDRIIVQPNAGAEEVRRGLARRGYAVILERLVPDGDRFFLIMAAEPAPPRELGLEEAFVGRLRLDPLFELWASRQREHLGRKPDDPRLRLLSASAGS